MRGRLHWPVFDGPDPQVHHVHPTTPNLQVCRGWRQHRAVHYAAHARANARTCSPGEDPFTDVTSSRVCLPSSSSTNESSQCVSVPLVRTILTMFCSCTSLLSNRVWRRASSSSLQHARPT